MEMLKSYRLRTNLIIITLMLCFWGCENKNGEIIPVVVDSIPIDVVYTLGANRYGVIGDSTEMDANQPYLIPGLCKIVKVIASNQISMALSSKGQVYTWGNNEYGQLGTGDSAKIGTTPRYVKGLSDIKKIATGGYISMALDKNGEVWMWGTIFSDAYKEKPPFFTSALPVKVNLSDIIDIGCGVGHCVAVSSSGDIYTWGVNVVGTLGDGTSINRNEPQKISGIANIKKVSVGAYHTLALSNDNKLYSWGNNLHGELGNGSYNNEELSPSLISSLHNVVDIAAGENHNLCLLSDGSLWGWGENYSGQVGNGSTLSKFYTPVQITTLTGIKLFGASGSTSIALTTDGKFWAWGNFNFSSSDMGYSGYSKRIPTRIESLDNSKQIATGGFHYVVVKDSADVIINNVQQ